MPIQDLLAAGNRLLKTHVAALASGVQLGGEERLGEKILQLTRAVKHDALRPRELFFADDGDDPLQLVAFLEMLQRPLRDLDMMLADDLHAQHARGGLQRIHGRIQSPLDVQAGERQDGIQMRKDGDHGRIGHVIRRHIDRFHRGDAGAPMRTDALMKLADLAGQRRLIAGFGRDPPQQGGELAARLGESKDVVHEQQDILSLGLERLGQRQAHMGRLKSRPRWLVNLPEHQHRARQQIGAHELMIELVAFAGAFADPREYAHPALLADDVVDDLQDQEALAQRRPAEDPGLGPFQEREQQIDHLDPGFHQFKFQLSFLIQRPGHLLGGVTPDGHDGRRTRRSFAVDRLTQHIHDPPIQMLGLRNVQPSAGGHDHRVTLQPVGRSERDAPAHLGLAVLHHLEHDGRTFQGGHPQDLINPRRGRGLVELHVDDGTIDRNDFADLLRHSAGPKNGKTKKLKNPKTRPFFGFLVFWFFGSSRNLHARCRDFSNGLIRQGVEVLDVLQPKLLAGARELLIAALQMHDAGRQFRELAGEEDFG